MKTRLGTRIGQKTLEEEFKRHPNTKECSESKGPFGTFGVLSKSAKLASFGFWPNSLWVTIRYTIFRSFRKRMHPDCRAYFLESSSLYKQRLNLIIQYLFFLHFGRHTFQALKLPIFYDPFSECCCLNQGFQVSKRIS